MELTRCSECGTYETSVDIHGRVYWYFKKYSKMTLCKKCYDRIRNVDYSPKRMKYKERTIHLKFRPRTGKCSKCKKRRRTSIHHEEYDDNNPLAHVVELCISCHTKETWKLGQYDEKMKHFEETMNRDPETGRFRKKVKLDNKH